MTNDQIKEVHKLFALGITKNEVAARLGITRFAVLRALKKNYDLITFPKIPNSDITVDEILAYKKKIYKNKKQSYDFNKLINITVRDDRPIGITCVGDVHVDDDGCDIIQLEHDLNVIKNTEGMYAGHVGDITNRWVGRLARLYANQVTTSSQAIKLAEWVLTSAPNLFVVAGNHDMWNEGIQVLDFILRQQNTVLSPHGVRLGLNFPSGKQIRIHCRHDFKGFSQYNSTHGHRKEQLWGGNRDHIYVSGHRHHDACSVTPQPDGTCSWAFMVSGYKVIDDYAAEHGFQSQTMSPSVTLILNPNAKTQAEVVKPFWDIEEGAKYLTYLRNKK